MFAGTLASAPAPYMNNSNMRYPAATITVENIPHTAHLTEQNNEAGSFEYTTATTAAGTYKKYPPRRSDMAEPMPAARAPYTGPNMIPLNTTIASPG